MPKVSIIIPTYNSSLFIKRTIESILAQTFTDWELLIIDDCSTDDTVNLINEFIKNNQRIKLLKTEKNSGGPALPKNLGFRFSAGEFVAYLDHDDEWLPNKLEKQMSVFENSKDKNLGLVSCGAFLVSEKNKLFSTFIPLKKENLLPEILLRNPIYSNSSVLMKRTVIETVGERDKTMKYSEDWDMWIRIIEAGYNIDHVCKPLFKYHFHKENTTKKSSAIIKIKDAEYVFEKHKNLYLKYNYIHIGYFRLGVMYFLGGDSKRGRQCFKNSIKVNKLFIPAYIGYALSVLGIIGKIIIIFLIFTYRILHGRKYLLYSHEF